MKKLYRSRSQRVIGGICGGLGEFLEVDPTIIRLLWVVLVLMAGTGIIVYLVALLIIPEEPGTGRSAF